MNWRRVIYWREYGTYNFSYYFVTFLITFFTILLSFAKVIIILVQEILQHVRPPNFEWFQSFYWYLTLEFGHQGIFEKNNHLPLMFLIWKHKLSLLGLKNRWANMLINLLNQKNNGFNKLKFSYLPCIVMPYFGLHLTKNWKWIILKRVF